MRNLFWVKSAISVVAVVLIIVHLFIPSIKVDIITLGLLIAGVVPWLSSIIKAMEFPGGWKVEFQDLKNITERADHAKLLSEQTYKKYSFESIAEDNPNLALAGLRIEIEKTLKEIALREGISDIHSINQLTSVLNQVGTISAEQASLIRDLVPMLNEAVHGKSVDPRAAEWAIITGPRILNALEKVKSE